MDQDHNGRHPLANAKPSSSSKDNNNNNNNNDDDNHSPSEPRNENAYVDAPEDTVPQEPPSLDSLSKEPNRDHRKWYPKYGRVQKCDWCNARSRGTLHVCTICAIRMCEDCARDRRWHPNRNHFIDADALDWVMKKVARAPRQPRQSKPPNKKVPAKRAASASPDKEPKTPPPAPRRRKLVETDYNTPDDEDEDDEDDEDGEDDDSAGHGNNKPANAGPGQSHFPPPANPRGDSGPRPPPPVPSYYDHNQAALRYHQAPIHGGYTPYGRIEPHMHGYYGPPVPAPTAPPMAGPSTRQDGRRQLPATKPKLNNSEQSRRASGSRLDDYGNDGNGGGDDDLESRQDEDGNEVAEEKGHADNANDSHRRHSARSTGGSHARTLSQVSTDRGGTSPQASAAQGTRTLAERPAMTPQDREHDRLVVDIYNWLYGDRPPLDPNRVRTRIPDQWQPPRQALVPQYHPEPTPYGHGQYPAPYGHPHQHMYPPAPQGYPPYPLHQPYLEYPPYPPYAPYPPHPAAAAAPHNHNNNPNTAYPPTHPSHNNNNNNNNNNTHPAAAAHPAAAHQAAPAPYHPAYLQDLAFAQHQHEHDRSTLEQLARAWAHNTILLRLVARNHRVYAIQMLWEVFALRRRVEREMSLMEVGGRRRSGDGGGSYGDGAGGSCGGGDGDGAGAGGEGEGDGGEGVDAFPQTVRWFVGERDSQFRMEYETTRAQREARAQVLDRGGHDRAQAGVVRGAVHHLGEGGAVHHHGEARAGSAGSEGAAAASGGAASSAGSDRAVVDDDDTESEEVEEKE
ncbi:uncharacterized protein B0H64DRAFT_449810 [Chaetomium fimeti]|uniref:Uncharacterized protein n=1 Tax=Chaetomium fimeti TaxID=1854472 RepID=A0AAE0HSV2_9PEZI|nr:hypothetical protein B0H64DRAFT_449810 [Chaetomium fimeti]